MLKKLSTGLCVLFSAFLLPAVAWAQLGAGNTSVTGIWSAGGFVVTIFAGVVLAFAFQVLLTQLSVALGITAIGNLEEKAAKAGTEETEEIRPAESLKKISGVFGVWMIVTVSLSLFFASMLAVKLSLIPANSVGVTLGLVIWAVFFSVLSFLELKSVTSLLGGLWQAAAGGMRNIMGGVQHTLAPDPSHKIEQIVRKSAAALREELVGDFNFKKFGKEVNRFLSRLQAKQMDPEKIGNGLGKWFQEIEVDEKTDPNTKDHHYFIKLGDHKNRLKGIDLGKTAESVKSAAQQEHPAEPVLAAVGSAVTGKSREEVQRMTQKIENYLRSTHLEQLNPDNIKRDLERVIHEPGSTREVIMSRIQQLNPSALLSVLKGRGDVNREQAGRIVDSVKGALSSFKEKLSQTAAQAKPEQLGSWMEEKISAYLGSIGRPEFSYEGLKQDFLQMLHDPKSTPQVMRERLGRYDRESFLDFVTSKGKIPRENAEKFVDQFEEARDEILHKAEEVQEVVKNKLEDARWKMIEEAEKSRKLAMAASWWLFIAAVISGSAAGFGAVLAL